MVQWKKRRASINGTLQDWVWINWKDKFGTRTSKKHSWRHKSHKKIAWNTFLVGWWNWIWCGLEIILRLQCRLLSSKELTFQLNQHCFQSKHWFHREKIHSQSIQLRRCHFNNWRSYFLNYVAYISTCSFLCYAIFMESCYSGPKETSPII